MLRLYESRFAGPDDRQAVRILDLPHLITACSADGSRHHLLFQEEGRQFQVACSGDIDNPVRLLADIAVEKWRIIPQLNAIGCFLHFCNSGRLRPRYFPAEPRGRRLSSTLVALDLWLAGTTHRQIGEAVYGIERVDRDWGDPGDHLKDGVRRLVSRGRALMEGGYRTLLK